MNNNVNTISENLLGILIKLLFITNIRMKVIGELLNLEGNHISKDNSAIIFKATPHKVHKLEIKHD